MTIKNGAAINLSAGSVTATTLREVGTGNFNFTGGTLSVDTFEGDLTQDGGTLAPGSSAGITNITGNYNLNSGTYEAELAGGGGVAGTDFDQVDVTGNVNLVGGSLDVSLLSPFTPSLGQFFDIVNVGSSLTGTFSGLSQGALVGNFGGTDLFINYASGDGYDISLVATLAGDFDLGFEVDGFDFLKWQRGESPNPLSQADLIAWEANYGVVAALSAASAAVPEPSSIMLILAATLVVYLQTARQSPRSQQLVDA